MNVSFDPGRNQVFHGRWLPVVMTKRIGRQFSAVMSLLVGPFPTAAAAEVWEKRFVQEHIGLADSTDSHRSEGRTISGATLKEVASVERLQISLAPQDYNLVSPHIHFEITAGSPCTLSRGHSPDWDIDIRRTSPGDAARNFGELVRNHIRKALDE